MEGLENEFDAAFEGDEAVDMILKLSSDAYTRTVEKISIASIGYTQPVKAGRTETLAGLTASIADLGVLVPIHVMKTAEEDADDDYKYILLDGLRRVYGALKHGDKEIQAVVWDFSDKDRGMELALVVSLILNRVQRRTWGEKWTLYRILEMQHDNLTPGTLEYLLDMQAGEAMKLKDVMLCDYDEVKEALISGEKDLEGAYKLLQKARKEEDKLFMDDTRGIEDIVEGGEDIAQEQEDTASLSDDDVRELLEMTENLDDIDEVSEDDFADMNAVADGFVDAQQVGERHPLDPALRQAVLSRDKFRCQCCDMHMIGARLGLIAVHHKICVHSGGKDEMENLTTLCVGCHVALHIMERNGGSIMMGKEDFDSLSENEQISLKRCLKLARVAIEADKRRGLSKDEIKEATRDAVKHPMPGVGMKENQVAYANAQ